MGGVLIYYQHQRDHRMQQEFDRSLWNNHRLHPSPCLVPVLRFYRESEPRSPTIH
jgi:hypothetical protein